MKRIYTVMFAVSVSLALVAGGLLATYGLPLGIDFKGGSVLSVTITGERPSVSQVREAITTSLGDVQSLTEVQLAPAGETGMILRSGPLDEDEHRALLEVLDESSGAPVVEESFESVGPAIGAELKSASIPEYVPNTLALGDGPGRAGRPVP
jgi:preprotein translocase subunit SecF